MSPRILLIEDNEELAAGIRHNLELEGYEVECELDGVAGFDRARAAPPDLLILDVMLPGMDGFQILKGLREKGCDMPVLILSARGEEADKVRGFRLDADQYVTKPFGLLELLERVRSLLRKSASPPHRPDPSSFSFGDVEVDADARKILRRGVQVALTPKAFELLMALMANEGRVVSRHDLLREVWGHQAAIVTRTVDSHVSELRHKLEADPANPRHIHTVWKVGYRFER